MRVGMCVIDLKHNQLGVITAIHDSLSEACKDLASMTEREWLAEQAIPFTPDQIAEKWATLRCESGGMFLSPFRSSMSRRSNLISVTRNPRLLARVHPMACILVLRNQSGGEQYFESGTGWVSSQSSATTYATKEASLVDGETQRELLGNGALLSVKDLVTGEDDPIPAFTDR